MATINYSAIHNAYMEGLFRDVDLYDKYNFCYPYYGLSKFNSSVRSAFHILYAIKIEKKNTIQDISKYTGYHKNTVSLFCNYLIELNIIKNVSIHPPNVYECVYKN